jgi:flagellin-specific chaperone FliS
MKPQLLRITAVWLIPFLVANGTSSLRPAGLEVCPVQTNAPRSAFKEQALTLRDPWILSLRDHIHDRTIRLIATAQVQSVPLILRYGPQLAAFVSVLPVILGMTSHHSDLHVLASGVLPFADPFPSRDQEIFGTGLEAWLAAHNQKRPTKDRFQAAATLAEDGLFWTLVDELQGDLGLALVRHAVANNIILGTRNLYAIVRAIKDKLPMAKRAGIPSLQLPLSAYVNFRLTLEDPRVQRYLDSKEFEDLDKEDKFPGLVSKILELGLPLGSENLGQIFGALPQQLSSHRAKRDLQYVNLPLKTFRQVRAAIGDPRIQKHLDSPEYQFLAKEDKLAALVSTILELELPFQSQSLKHIFCALPQRLSAKTAKNDIHKVDMPLKVFRQVRAALADARMQKYLDSQGYCDLPKEDKLAALINMILELKLPLESENLAHVHSALPQRLSAATVKGDIQKVELPFKVFRQARDAIGDPRIQKHLDSPVYQGLGKADKLAELVNEILKLNITLDSENLSQIFSALPQHLSMKTVKADIQKVELPLKVFRQVRGALRNMRIQNYLESKEYQGLDKEDRLAALVNMILELELPLESENLAKVFSALPQQLSPRTFKEDIQKVELSLKVFWQVRAALHDPRIQEYLDSQEYQSLAKENRLAALASKIIQLDLPLESENLRQIYTTLPQRLSAQTTKDDIQCVILSFKVFRQLRAAIGDPRMQKYLDSPAYQGLPKEDRLVALVNMILELKLPMDSENLGQVFSALPQRLSGTTAKEGIQRVDLSLKVFRQLRSAIRDDRVQKYLDSDEYQALAKEDKLAELMNKIVKLGLPLELQDLRLGYSALPWKLSMLTTKRDIQCINLPLKVFRQVRAAIADPRMQKYLDSPAYQDLPKEDKLVAVVNMILELELPMDSENLGAVFSALPQRLSANVTKADMQYVRLPLKQFRQVRAALSNAQIQNYLDSEEYQSFPKEDKLAGFVKKITELRLPLESDSLSQLYLALPQRLSKLTIKRDLQRVDLQLKEFERLRIFLEHPDQNGSISRMREEGLFGIALIEALKQLPDWPLVGLATSRAILTAFPRHLKRFRIIPIRIEPWEDPDKIPDVNTNISRDVVQNLDAARVVGALRRFFEGEDTLVSAIAHAADLDDHAAAAELPAIEVSQLPELLRKAQHMIQDAINRHNPGIQPILELLSFEHHVRRREAGSA